ncbi:Rho termination factor N-terminal domain-containing protein, partial [Microcella sp.]|uniref:Rho termination factor N-terminal domain-containing protein n=1 Tax=Microcella sp. TaxID=1913979 RepID=UPI00391CF7AA
MTDPIVRASSADAPADLGTLKLAELQQLATELGVAGVSKLRKGELVDAITQNRAESAGEAPEAEPAADLAAAPTVEAVEPAAAPVADEAPRR